MVIKDIVYVASPYSGSDYQTRYEQVTSYVAKLNANGIVAFSPIAYGHTLIQFHPMPSDWKFWETFCLSFLHNCNKMHVLMLDGWETSVGVQDEIVFAKSHGMTIEYHDL